ncbi:TRAP transporter small permease [Rhodoligotrophos defluvii]|uniref:TRAP transporter small permease n=1 Tax=Rhodoligotrophos defluvii TaxID=2561934 RepID=UPI0010C948F5|nr:TRAP transporter small permease subunit [Rhodoligotrophos defluvii]
MRRLGRLLAGMVTAATVIGAVAVVLMMLQIVADVVVRVGLNWRLPITTIIVANYYMVIVTYLPLALAEKLNRNISVEILFNHLSARWQHALGAGVLLFSGAVSAGLAWQLWVEAMKKYRIGAFIVEHELSAPIWPSYFALPLGFGLLSLLLFYRFACSIAGLSSGLGEEQPGRERAAPE